MNSTKTGVVRFFLCVCICVVGSLITSVCFSRRISTMSRGCFRRVSGPRASLLRPWLSTPEDACRSLWLRPQPHSPSTTRSVPSASYILCTAVRKCRHRLGVKRLSEQRESVRHSHLQFQVFGMCHDATEEPRVWLEVLPPAAKYLINVISQPLSFVFKCGK